MVRFPPAWVIPVVDWVVVSPAMTTTVCHHTHTREMEHRILPNINMTLFEEDISKLDSHHLPFPNGSCVIHGKLRAPKAPIWLRQTEPSMIFVNQPVTTLVTSGQTNQANQTLNSTDKLTKPVMPDECLHHVTVDSQIHPACGFVCREIFQLHRLSTNFVVFFEKLTQNNFAENWKI